MDVADQGPYDECTLANEGQDLAWAPVHALIRQGSSQQVRLMNCITNSSSIRACATCIAASDLDLLIIKTHALPFGLHNVKAQLHFECLVQMFLYLLTAGLYYLPCFDSVETWLLQTKDRMTSVLLPTKVKTT